MRRVRLSAIIRQPANKPQWGLPVRAHGWDRWTAVTARNGLSSGGGISSAGAGAVKMTAPYPWSAKKPLPQTWGRGPFLFYSDAASSSMDGMRTFCDADKLL